MAGYTPLFSTLTTGTLCGKWPDIGLWPIVLSMADKHGVVDCTQAYIAGVTGLAVDEVRACMTRFCEPDPGSRSDEYHGARLVLLDDHRDWGWRVVNHGMYREKARKAAQQIEATESGSDAERKRAERAAHKNVSGDVRPCPAKSSADRPSDADADADAVRVRGQPSAAPSPQNGSKAPEAKEQPTPPNARGRGKARKTPFPDDFELGAELEQYVVDRLPDADPPGVMEKFRGQAIAKGWTYANWRQAFQEYVRNASPNSGHWAAGQYPRKAGQPRVSFGGMQ